MPPPSLTKLPFPRAVRARAVVATAAVGVIGLAGCGGGSSSTTSSTAATTKPHTTPAAASLAEVVRVGGHPPGSSGLVHPGSPVVLTTVVRVPIGATRQNVSLRVTTGPASRLTVTATAAAQSSTATLTSAGGTPITLVHLSYACALPPRATFCPPHAVAVHGGTLHLSFDVPRGAPPTIDAVVGSSRTAGAPVPSAGSEVRAPYALATLVRSLAPPSASAPAPLPTPFGSSVSAGRGDMVTIIPHVTGAPGGAPQVITLRIEEGPATALHVTASFPGGTPSTATVKSANGKPIALRIPAYTCALGPAATFCPARHVSSTSGTLTLAFTTAPGLPPIVLEGLITGG